MSKTNPIPPLVAAAAAVDEELRGYADLARDAKRIALDSEKSLARAAKLLQESTARQPRIQEKLKALVDEIERARVTQQESLEGIVSVARHLEERAADFDALLRRFAALGESARAINQLTGELSVKRQAGAKDAELLGGVRDLEERMTQVVTDADALAKDAESGQWPDIARQADSVRQQVRAAKNKLLLAQDALAPTATSLNGASKPPSGAPS